MLLYYLSFPFLSSPSSNGEIAHSNVYMKCSQPFRKICRPPHSIYTKYHLDCCTLLIINARTDTTTHSYTIHDLIWKCAGKKPESSTSIMVEDLQNGKKDETYTFVYISPVHSLSFERQVVKIGTNTKHKTTPFTCRLNLMNKVVHAIDVK